MARGENDNVGGLLGLNNIGGTVIASYATGNADGDSVGRFVGFNATFDSSVFTESYGFGMPTQSGQTVTDADTLQITDSSATTTYAGDTWNNADDDTLNAWDFGNDSQPPALRYADYDGAGTDYTCDMFPATIPGTTMTLDCDTTTDTFTSFPYWNSRYIQRASPNAPIYTRIIICASLIGIPICTRAFCLRATRPSTCTEMRSVLETTVARTL